MASVFLIGFMASGKTTVGRALAATDGLRFIDLDAVIEADAGKTVAEIFATESEAGFRQRESRALVNVIGEVKTSPAVVATGGGTPTNVDNLEQMRAAGLVVELTAPLETLLARAKADGGSAVRPLLARGEDDVRELLADRGSIYRQAHATVASEPGCHQRISALRALAGKFERLDDVAICALSERAYPIVTKEGVLDELGELVERLIARPSSIGIVTDDNVAPLYLERARTALDSLGVNIATVTIAAGEASKTPEEHARVAAELAGRGLDRSSLIVALGGGVVGDLAGYVASSLFRGISVVQVPTTLLAMTDSAIGGKTGVNLAAGKNLLGAFWQPQFVAIDPLTLKTLPPRELRAAIGELYKYGLLDGEELYAKIDQFAAGDDAVAGEVIRRCAGYKAWVVTRDERETTGERALLNLGHTVGHAIERAAGYGEVLHGEAVALGLVAAARVSTAIGFAASDLEARLAHSLSAAGLDVDLGPWLRPEVLDYIGVDKKRTGSRIKFIAMRGVGVVEIAELDTSEIAKILLPPSGL